MYTCCIQEEKVDVRLYNKDNEVFKHEPLHEAVITPKRLVYGEQIVDVCRSLMNSEQYKKFMDENGIYS